MQKLGVRDLPSLVKLTIQHGITSLCPPFLQVLNGELSETLVLHGHQFLSEL